MSVRQFPMPRYDRKGEGWCRWCGKDVAKPARNWHRECLSEYFLHTRPDAQFHHLVKRDGKACSQCGSSPERWIGQLVFICGGLVDEYWSRDDMRRYGCYGERFGQATMIQRTHALHIDHTVPLWSVAHLPDEERRPYFGPTNLNLRCSPCHKTKTAREAAERAALRRRAA